MPRRPPSVTKSTVPQCRQACLALNQLGRVHAPLLGPRGGADWLHRENPVSQPLMAALYAGFLDRYADRIAPEHRAVCDRLVEVFDAYLAADAAAEQPRGLVHGDYRLDNMLFGAAGADAKPLTVVDWQTVTWGPVLADAAYFLGCALPTEVRRDNYDALLRGLPRWAGGRYAPIDLDDGPRGCAAAELLRRDDGHRIVDDGRAHRPR